MGLRYTSHTTTAREVPTALRRGIVQLRRTALPVAIAALVLTGTYVALSSTQSGAADLGQPRALRRASRPTAYGPEWERSANQVRVVPPRCAGWAPRRFISPCSTTPPTPLSPDSKRSCVQQAMAFAAWCNASGGINGRDIVIDDRDAALFNAAQVTEQACQSDFMAVGGGMALDQPSVPIREQCGLGQISGYLASDASDVASDQVDPGGANTDTWPSGWFRALAKAYPQAVKKAGMGGANTPSILEPERKYEFGAEAQGWKVVDFQEPPIAVTDWAPYIEEAQSKGVEALWPSLDDNIVPYFQAMTTAGYHPAFVILGVQFYNSTTSERRGRQPRPPAGLRRDVVVAARDGLAEPLDRAVRQHHAHLCQRRRRRLRRRGGRGVVAPVGEVCLVLWRRPDGLVRVGPRRRHEELGRRRHPGAHRELDPVNRPQPSPCFAMLKAEPNRFVYDKAVTQPDQSIWNCDPKNVVHLTSQQRQQLASL